jgi:hypothetical protein
MTITTNGDLDVIDDSAILVPAMAAEPLQTALENLNYLFKWHRPALVDYCPTADDLQTRNTFVIPIIPSVDGMLYTFQHRIVASNTSTCAITVEYTTTAAMSVWTNIYTDAAVATTAATLLTNSKVDQVIPASAVALRVDYQMAAGTLFVHHILALPSPAAPTAGITTSGFVPFDDGMLSSTGAPIHTELLNRCKLSALAVLRDRYQCAFSFGQKDGPVLIPTPAHLPAADTDWYALPIVRAWFPWQGPDVTVHWRALATVSGGATTSMVRVRQVSVTDGEVRAFDADGVIQSGLQIVAGGGTSAAAMTLHLQGEGAMRYADIELSGKASNGNRTSIRAAFAFWRPTE